MTTPELSPDYWDCECDDYYIHHKTTFVCPQCGMDRNEQPDSHAKELEDDKNFTDYQLIRNALRDRLFRIYMKMKDGEGVYYAETSWEEDDEDDTQILRIDAESLGRWLHLHYKEHDATRAVLAICDEFYEHCRESNPDDTDDELDEAYNQGMLDGERLCALRGSFYRKVSGGWSIAIRCYPSKPFDSREFHQIVGYDFAPGDSYESLMEGLK